MYMQKTFLWLFSFLLAVLLLTGCGGTGPTGNEQEEAGAEFELILEDGMGRRVQLTGMPERIISLAPSNTEMLFALGLQEKVVGVSEYCNYPPEALEIPRAGSFSEPNIEQILSLEPDLVIAVPLQDKEFSRLEELGIPLLAVDPTSVEEIYSSLELIGEATGAEEEASLLVEDLREKIGAVKEKVGHLSPEERVRVYYEVYSDPLMSVGGDTVIHELLEAAGGINIFEDMEAAYPQVSSEVIVDRDPEVIVFPDYHGTEEFPVREILERSGWGSVSAVQDDRVYGVDPDKISRSGPRIAEVVEELAELFYPDI